MAKGRKPAIDGLARPQGILDDVVYPIVQKAAKAASRKLITGTSKKSYRAYHRALQLEDAMAAKRIKSYSAKGSKSFEKAKDSYRAYTSTNKPSKHKASVRQAVRANAMDVKSHVLEQQLQGGGRGSVRKAAKAARKETRKSWR